MGRSGGAQPTNLRRQVEAVVEYVDRCVSPFFRLLFPFLRKGQLGI